MRGLPYYIIVGNIGIMENKMETTMILGLYWGTIVVSIYFPLSQYIPYYTANLVSWQSLYAVSVARNGNAELDKPQRVCVWLSVP